MGAGGSCLTQPEGSAAGGEAMPSKAMTPQQLETLKKSIEDLGKLKDGALQVGILSFKGLFVVSPETFPIFEFEEADWENSHHFIHHCKMVMNTIIHIIKIYSDDEKLIRNMDVMGMRHSMLNLPSRHFELLGVEMVKALRAVLVDQFTPACEEAWTLVYKLLSDMLQARMTKYNVDIGYKITLE